jgi:hypothetical protein
LSASDQNRRATWYREPKGEAHTTLVPVFKMVRDQNAWRVDADEYHAGLYCSSDRPGVKGRSQKGYEYGPSTLPYNVCRSAVDTLQAKIAQHRPLPQVLTQKGSWKDQKRAKKQTQFLEGEFYRQRIFERQAKTIIRDAEIFGRGIIKVWVEGRRIKTERVLPWELFDDEWDAKHGMPRNRYHCRSVDKGVLLEQFARTANGGWSNTIAEAINGAGRFDIQETWDSEGTCTVDRIDIIEAWHLCDRPEEHEQAEDDEARDPHEEGEDEDDEPESEKKPARDQGEQPRKHKCTGRHVVVTTAGTLIDEPWEYNYFPFAVLGYNDPIVGSDLHAHGLVEQLEGYQYEINASAERLAEMFHLSGVMVAVPDNAKVHDQQIRNGVHILRHAAGGVPQVLKMDLVTDSVRVRPRELRSDALSDAGISEMSAQSDKPAGIQSGIGLQTLDDIESQRFMVFGRAYESWCLELGRRFLDCAKMIAESYGDYAVTVPMKGGLIKLRWNDVYVEGVELRVFPTSLLPQQIGARLDKLMMLFETQVIDRATFLRHLEAPDMQAELDLETADKLVIDEIIERMLDAEEEDGESAYIAPSAYQDFAWAARRAQQKYNRAWLDGAPEYNLEMLQRYMQRCDVKMKEQQAPPAAGPAPQPAGNPMMTPEAGAPLPAGPAAPALPPIPGMLGAA